MSGSVSMYLRSRLLSAYFQPDIDYSDDELWVALTTVLAPSNAVGTQLVEPAAASYGRAAAPLSSGIWQLSGYSEVFNAVEIDFPTPADGDDWGLVRGWALVSSQTGGMALAVGALPPTYVAAGQPVTIDPSGIIVGLND